MYFEKDLQEFLFEKGTIESEENSFNDQIDIIEKEFQLEKFGKVDLLGVSDNFFYIIELKREIINANALVQVLRYRTAFEEIVDTAKPVRCILIAPSIDNETHSAIIGMNESVCYIKNIHSFSFEACDYSLIIDINKKKSINEYLIEIDGDSRELYFFDELKQSFLMPIYDSYIKKIFEIIEKVEKKVKIIIKKLNFNNIENLLNMIYEYFCFDLDAILEINKDEVDIENIVYCELEKEMDALLKNIIEFLTGELDGDI